MVQILVVKSPFLLKSNPAFLSFIFANMGPQLMTDHPRALMMLGKLSASLELKIWLSSRAWSDETFAAA